MTDRSVADIRNAFISHFVKHGHTHVPSSPLVPENDPTVMFTMAGMMQFKNVFTGSESRPYTRAVTAQKCVRAGGKHNDLDNVGYTNRHHTFFEMMGNFSFGDYFKEEAISYAWELVTREFKMDTSRMLVTVHSSDEEAAALWRKISGFSDNRIIRIDTNDNFWMMGDTGPCGPCTELFFDQGDHIAGGPPGSPDEDGDRFLEFWNNVFMQYEQEPDGQGGYIRRPLPKPSIDTGMGLERMTSILQGKGTNYGIDIFRAIIEHVADITGVSPDGNQMASHRVIADHLRSAAFLIADGVLPSNEGRGYVLRRIMRRGMRHAHLLGARDPLMHKLFPTLLEKMGAVYPELGRAQSLITSTLEQEEKRFRKTLETGMRLLQDEEGKLGSGQKLPGDVAFKLYDTYGFPLDLTQDALRVKNIDVDVDGFNVCMEKQRAESRKSWSGAGGSFTDKIWFDLLERCGATEFLGYDRDGTQAEVRAIVKDGAEIKESATGDTVQVIVNQTPFYAESGGQVGDIGTIVSDNGLKAAVIDTQKVAGSLFVHTARIESGTLKSGDTVHLAIDTDRRAAIRSNHSSTHLLHEALRRVLGDHVAQKGSRQDDVRTRFDIAHSAPLTDDQIRAVETFVNAEIRANTPVETRILSIDDAMQSGAMALFGEKYGDEVRVVYMGRADDKGNKPFSVELCGGTHVKQTGDIGAFKIVAQGAVSAGVRRIEAVTGANVIAYLNDLEEMMDTLADVLKTGRSDVTSRVRALLDERKKMESEITNLRRQVASGGGNAGSASDTDIQEAAGIRYTTRILDGFPAKDLKPLADDLKQKMGSGVVVLISAEEGRASIVVGVTPDLTSRVSAVDLVRVGAAALGGSGGGGRPDMAQAGGPNASAAKEAVDQIIKVFAA